MIKEADLYPPLKTWLEANGYQVHAEVNDCDVVAQKNDELVVVEMKRAINLDLVLQITKRQEIAASVYAAVPAPRTGGRRWRRLLRLLKRLEAGLLLVYLDTALPRVELAFHPLPYQRKRNHAATRALLRETAGRSLDLNVGGGNRAKLMTAYKEQALKTAAALERLGPATPKALRQIGAPAKATPILYKNHYGWFERLRPGLYALTAAGAAALKEHGKLSDKLRESLNG